MLAGAVYPYSMADQNETGALIHDGFDCPICGFDAYCRVIVFRPDGTPQGQRYVTDFWRCGGCQVMFANPAAFSTKLAFGSRANRPLRTTPIS